MGSLVWGPRVGGIRIDTTRRVLWTRKILGALSEARVGAHRGLLSPGRLPLVSPSSCWSAPERSACFERPVSRSRRSPVGRVSRAQLYLRHARQGLPRSSQVILTPHVCLDADATHHEACNRADSSAHSRSPDRGFPSRRAPRVRARCPIARVSNPRHPTRNHLRPRYHPSEFPREGNQENFAQIVCFCETVFFAYYTILSK